MKPEPTKTPKAIKDIKKTNILYILNPGTNKVDDAIYTVDKVTTTKIQGSIEYMNHGHASFSFTKSKIGNLTFIEQD